MAVITTNLSCELQEAVRVQYLKGNLFSQDVQANKISVAVYDGGSPATISGTVTANIIREDGGTVTATGGTISGNVVSITLPAAAYIVPGLVSIVIKVTASSVTTTIAAVVVNVYQSSTETAIDPGTIIPSVTALVAQIEAAVASIPADYSSLWTSLAPAFSSSASYTPGQYVTNGGVLYVCTTSHTGSWNASHFSAVNVGGELSRVFGALTQNYDELKSEIDVFQDDITGDKIVKNQTARINMTAGILSKNGNVTSSTSAGYFNAPIEVSPGEIITAQKAYYDSNNILTGITNTDIRSCAYFADNTHTFTNNGFDTAKSSFTVPDGIHYIQPTFSGIMTGTYTQIIIVRTTEHGQTNQKILDLLDGDFPSKNLENNYGCALPISVFRMTVGIPEKWYKKSMATPPTDFIMATGGYSTSEQENDGVYFENASTISSTNGYIWKHYDPMLVLISEYLGSTGIGGARRVLAENLSDCSLLAIGDSTVDHDVMTAKLLSYFTEKNHTITLLGTLGSSTDPNNKNEGRAGWTTADYLANTTKNGYTNPFWNPTTQAFDFSYYMSQQGYSGVDFVVIQLGINDLYGSTTFPVIDIEQVWENIETMIESIFAYNTSIKIILNLPTTPNSDQSEHPIAEFLYRNRVIKYNEYAIKQSLATYGETKVRASYCHLILNPATEIRDNVHPTNDGYEKMGLEIINQINVWQNGY